MSRQASLPDVEGGIFAARKVRRLGEALGVFPTRLVMREVSSAGLGSPALRQARMPAATAEPEQLRDRHIDLKVKRPVAAPAAKA